MSSAELETKIKDVTQDYHTKLQQLNVTSIADSPSTWLSFLAMR